jgi:hypothetical protein
MQRDTAPVVAGVLTAWRSPLARASWLIAVVIAAGLAVFGPWATVGYALFAPALFLVWDRVTTRRKARLASVPREPADGSGDA